MMRQRFAQREPFTSFYDRVEAGQRLAEHLREYQGPHTLVLGIPRGGVPVAAEVAKRLDAELDIVVARKLGAPGSPELAIGATTANGSLYLNELALMQLHVSMAYLDQEITSETAEARHREERLRDARPRAPIAGRTVIVVDDGLATGATMLAAVRSVRTAQPGKLIVAVPVGSRDACRALLTEVDEVVCPYQPQPFFAVSLYYQHYEPTEDSTVQQILREAFARRQEAQQKAG